MKQIQVNKTNRLRRKCLYGLMVYCFGVSAASQAMELETTLFSETEYTTNSRLVTTNTEDDVIERVGLNVVLSEERKRFNANARFNLSQEFYLKNTFSDQTQLTTGFGLFNFDIIDDFLDWRTSFTRTDVLSDASAGDTPDNKEKRNVFRTGPSINYRINKASVFRFGSNYVQVENSDETAADTKRLEANANYIYQYNSVTNFSLNSSYDRVIETKENGRSFSNSDEQSKNITMSLGMNRQFSHGSFDIKFGRNEVRSSSNQRISGNYFDISLQRENVFYHDVLVQYSESISDSSIGFDSLQRLLSQSTQNLSSISNVASSLDILNRKQLDLSIDRVFDSFHYNFSAFWVKDDYEVQLSDEQSIGFTIRLDKQIREGLNVGVVFQHEKIKFSDQQELGENTTSTYQVDSSYQFTKSFSVNGNIGYEKRGNNKLFSREYEDFFMTLGFNLTLF